MIRIFTTFIYIFFVGNTRIFIVKLTVLVLSKTFCIQQYPYAVSLYERNVNCELVH